MLQAIVQTDNVYNVIVTVVDGDLHFSPDPVKVKKENSLITFNLLSPGYIFPTDGTALEVQDDGGEFPIAWYINPVLIGLADYNTARQTFAYTMNVQNIQTGKVISKDPTIENDNQPPGPGHL